MEGHIGEHPGQQTGDLGGDGQGDGVQLRLSVGRLLHGADGGGEALAGGADGDVGLVADVQLGHQGLRHGDLDLHLVHPVDYGHGHRGGDVGVLLGAEADQRAGDGGHHVARAVYIFQHVGQLLHIGLVALHPRLQLGQGAVPGGLGGFQLKLGLVDLQLAGRADLLELL